MRGVRGEMRKSSPLFHARCCAVGAPSDLRPRPVSFSGNKRRKQLNTLRNFACFNYTKYSYQIITGLLTYTNVIIHRKHLSLITHMRNLFTFFKRQAAQQTSPLRRENTLTVVLTGSRPTDEEIAARRERATMAIRKAEIAMKKADEEALALEQARYDRYATGRPRRLTAEEELRQHPVFQILFPF